MPRAIAIAASVSIPGMEIPFSTLDSVCVVMAARSDSTCWEIPVVVKL